MLRYVSFAEVDRLPGCVARTDAPVYIRERGGTGGEVLYKLAPESNADPTNRVTYEPCHSRFSQKHNQDNYSAANKQQDTSANKRRQSAKRGAEGFLATHDYHQDAR
jgi:hypothetical protein